NVPSFPTRRSSDLDSFSHFESMGFTLDHTRSSDQEEFTRTYVDVTDLKFHSTESNRPEGEHARHEGGLRRSRSLKHFVFILARSGIFTFGPLSLAAGIAPLPPPFVVPDA